MLILLILHHLEKYFKLMGFLKGFIIPADTFDNVKGQFPIGFLIWDTSISKKLYYIYIYIYEEKKNKVKKLGKKKIYSYDNEKYINEWYKNFYDKFEEIGIMNTRGNDFQNYNYIRSFHHAIILIIQI
ncbi:hypothetical protein OFS01_13920 [Brachyspira hyodysenteriae]|uniref:hypothetical protein n=1 Tax=Brachyspira hyodysenteriae TaxID=159 RepID=UPI0022CD90C9|nr:hypothetical protein [Brachyspira hyodysenteriae]MDA0106490.1 hypothetical protein [Brachyspira hyodysenteriae]